MKVNIKFDDQGRPEFDTSYRRQINLQALCDAISDNQTPEVLNLGDLDLTDQELKPIAEALKQNTTSKFLSLENNKLSDKGAVILSDMFKTNHTIHSVFLGENNIKEKGAKTLATRLEKSTTLNLIDFNNDYENIGKKGYKALEKASHTRLDKKFKEKNIKIFEFYGPLGKKGVSDIINVLDNNPSLETLNLIKCGINDQGAILLANKLKNNTKLLELNLNNNKIGDDGVIAIAEMLKTNKNLCTLHLDVDLTDKGANILLGTLQTDNRTITTLTIPSKIDPSIQQELNSCLDKNVQPSLREKLKHLDGKHLILKGDKELIKKTSPFPKVLMGEITSYLDTNKENPKSIEMMLMIAKDRQKPQTQEKDKEPPSTKSWRNKVSNKSGKEDNKGDRHK